MLPLVADQDGEFSRRAGANSGQPAHREDLSLGAFRALCDQCRFAVVVDETDSRQPVVLHPLAQFHQVEVAGVNRVFGKRPVEPHHHRLVLRPDGANGDVGSFLHRKSADILVWIGTDSELGQLFLPQFRRL